MLSTVQNRTFEGSPQATLLLQLFPSLLLLSLPRSTFPWKTSERNNSFFSSPLCVSLFFAPWASCLLLVSSLTANDSIISEGQPELWEESLEQWQMLIGATRGPQYWPWVALGLKGVNTVILIWRAESGYCLYSLCKFLRKGTNIGPQIVFKCNVADNLLLFPHA